MSLLGRLEDLSLTDIIQIVFLSRRTGILEIIDSNGRFTVLFQGGLIVNASSSDRPDLATYLMQAGVLDAKTLPMLREMERTARVPIGSAIVDMNIMSAEALGEAILQHVSEIVNYLLPSRDGEFNFILSESMDRLDVEYDPDQIFREGGIAPQRLLAADGEKLKPLKGLEESMKAGKALLRSRGEPSGGVAGALDLALGSLPMPSQPPAEPSADPFDFSASPLQEDGEAAPFAELVDEQFESEADVTSLLEEMKGPAAEEIELFPPSAAAEPLPSYALAQEPFPVDSFGQDPVEEPSLPPAGRQFRIEESFEKTPFEGAIVLFERDPLVRVAARRAFGRKEIQILQFGTLDDTRAAIGELLGENRFFVTFIDLGDGIDGGRDSASLIQLVKRQNQRLPVVVIDLDADLRRRHEMLKAGADLYLTKPSAMTLRPGSAEEELALFADELVLFAERSLVAYQQAAAARGEDRGRRFYEAAGKEKMERTVSLVRQLINEVSTPGDLTQLTQMMLRLASEYLDRGVLFTLADGAFIGLGGFGSAGGGHDVNQRARRIKIDASMPSVLADVVGQSQPHHGKIRKTDANVQLIEALGSLLPTQVVAIPIFDDSRIVAVFYGDNGEHRVPTGDLSGLAVFLAQAGQALGRALDGVMWAENQDTRRQ